MASLTDAERMFVEAWLARETPQFTEKQRPVRARCGEATRWVARRSPALPRRRPVPDVP